MYVLLSKASKFVHPPALSRSISRLSPLPTISLYFLSISPYQQFLWYFLGIYIIYVNTKWPFFPVAVSCKIISYFLTYGMRVHIGTLYFSIYFVNQIAISLETNNLSPVLVWMQQLSMYSCTCLGSLSRCDGRQFPYLVQSQRALHGCPLAGGYGKYAVAPQQKATKYVLAQNLMTQQIVRSTQSLMCCSWHNLIGPDIVCLHFSDH